MFKLSAIICAHNPRPAYLRRTLEALHGQDLPKQDWELLLVDNASQSALANAYDLSWHPHARHVLELQLGLSTARLRGIKELASDLLVFVDDDNVLDPNYLREVLRIKAEWPRLGAWGAGVIVPEYEVQPVERVKKLTGYLALRETTKARWSNVVLTQTIPLGAGLCVRESVADSYHNMNKEFAILISGRQGSGHLGGDDFEICHVACHLGLGIGIFPELRLTHLISKERVSPKYLLKIYEGSTISNILLAYKWNGIIPKSPLRPRGVLSLVKNLAVQQGLNWQMYLAHVRAQITARKMIELSSKPRAISDAANNRR